MKSATYTTKKIAVLGIFTAMSLVTFLLEGLLPPLLLPGAKPGLANIFSLAALVMYGPIEAFAVVAARTLLGAVFAGNVSQLLYSFTGGMCAMAVSALLMKFAHPRVSVMAISVAAAVTHNVVQILVYAALAQTASVMPYLPYFALIGVLSGVIVGTVVLLLFKAVPRTVFIRALA